jgi:hypothetical protein
VALAGRTLLRVFPILGEIPGEGDATSRELIAASWESVRLAAEVSGRVKPGKILMDEAGALYSRFTRLTRLYQANKTSASRSAWSVGTAAWRVTHSMFGRDFNYAAGQAASEALDAAWQSAGDDVDVVLDSFRLRAAIDHDIDSLVTAPSGEGLILGPLWPQELGKWPRWYRRYREWLTTTAVWQTLIAMLDKDSKRQQEDPALQEAFDAFDGAKLPRPLLTKLTGLTPEEGLDALRIVVKYLDSVADPVAKVVQLILNDLAGQSFESFAGTKEWGTLVQWVLERTGHAVICPKCSEPARIDTAPHRSSPAGSIRYRHPGATHGGSGTLPDPSLVPTDRPE